MSEGQQVEVSPDAEALSQAVSRRAQQVLAAATAERGEAHLVVTGGSILEPTLAALASPAGAVDWAAVHVWWGDERYVPADSTDRNDLPAMAKLFDHVPVDPAKLHRMPSSDAGFDSPDAAAASYAAELAAATGPDGALDLALIGIGPDGHCCSLFPGDPATGITDRAVAAVHQSAKPPPDRLTLTFPTLDAVRELWFVAAGDGKAEAVQKALSGTYDKVQIPSSAPRGTVATRWLIDQAAASTLP